MRLNMARDEDRRMARARERCNYVEDGVEPTFRSSDDYDVIRDAATEKHLLCMRPR